jgi:galactofuranosylgalactofuranosylrhamnosyl-N-acetylglucosaminyl-diphospho-decaprenol beta-1,5/1,6-galactofuranosyltransferase
MTTGDVPRGYRVLQRFIAPLEQHRGDARPLYVNGLMFDIDRHSAAIPGASFVSFGTYFNAFPASYWRRWTALDSVRLQLRVRGAGKITVCRSTSTGMSWPEQNIVVEGGPDVTTVTADLPLGPFIDGGWYWFDALAFVGNDLVIEGGEWLGLTDRLTYGRVSIGITTYNRPEFCLEQIRNLGASPDLISILDRVYVVDQGTQRVQDHPDFAEAKIGLGHRLQMIEQGNLGGSGGFSRAMHETIKADESDYLLLLDDDVITEPEGIIRAVTFADLAREPMIVGGHMLSIYVRSVLHAFGETIAKYRWFWGAAPNTFHGHDFGVGSLPSTPWLHRLVDVDYNGWWMCLIPVEVIHKVGFSVPMFIKWDDAEYGVRANEHGYRTVSLPGAAVWHVPWNLKDDGIDWQAYYHYRNRILTALLHSPFPHGGTILRESAIQTMKHTFAMQYSPAEMILMAVSDLLEGPDHLHRDLASKVDELRAMRKEYDDAKFSADLRDFPPVHHRKPAGRGKGTGEVHGRRSALKAFGRALPRQLSPLSDEARQHPQTSLPRPDQQWWRLAQYDSVLVTSADGTSAAWYRRDPAKFRSLVRRNAMLHADLYRRWDELAKTYREAVASLTSPEAWATTFAASEAQLHQPSSTDDDPADDEPSDDAPALALELPSNEPPGHPESMGYSRMTAEGT